MPIVSFLMTGWLTRQFATLDMSPHCKLGVTLNVSLLLTQAAQAEIAANFGYNFTLVQPVWWKQSSTIHKNRNKFI